jgi:thiol-disulfide isomerase/thioredoxin
VKRFWKLCSKTLFFALTVLFVCSCSKIGERNHIAFNSDKPLKTIFSASNKTFAISENRAFVLFFFSTDCAACKEALPYMNFFAKKYEGKVEIIGVMGGSKGFDKDAEFLRTADIRFKVVSDIKSVDYFSRSVGGIYGVPVFYTYDKDGLFSEKFLGLTPRNRLEEAIKKLI